MHNNIIAAGSRDRPPMLATGRYAQWRSRFLRYIDTRPNGDTLRKCIHEVAHAEEFALLMKIRITLSQRGINLSQRRVLVIVGMLCTLIDKSILKLLVTSLSYISFHIILLDHQRVTITLSSKVVDLILGNNKCIQQYLQNEHYALWEVIEFGDSYQAPPEETGKGSASESSTKKKGRIVAITTEDIQKRRNDVKARTTLLLALPDEHQLRFSKYETAQELWGAILKTFGGNETTKNTKKNQLKQQYGNFKAEDDLNQKFLTSLAPEWLMYIIVWRNIDDLDIMSLDDVYNHLKVYEPEVQNKSKTNSQNMAFISSSNTSSGKAFQSNGSQIKYVDITQIDEDDIEEIDIKWNMALLRLRADRFWKRTGKKITIQGSDVAGFDKSKVECFNCHKMGHFARECRAPRSQDRGKRESYRQGPKEEEHAPKALMAIDGMDGIGVTWPMRKRTMLLPTPSIDLSKSNTSDLQNSNTSVSKPGESSNSIMSKPMIKIVKAADSPGVIKTNKTKTARKPPVKYAEMYRNTSKSPKVRGNQRNWNNLKSQQLGKDFVMQNKTCFKCGHFDHLAYDCGVWVEKGKNWPNNNFAHKNVSPRAVLLKTGRTPIAVNRTNMNVAQLKMGSFAKTTHSNVRRPFQGKSVVRTQSRVPRVYTADLGNKGKAVKASACWIWRPKQTTTGKGPNCNGGNSQNNIDDKGYWDSGCSRQMTGNISYLSEYEPYDGGYVSFGQGGGEITGKGIIKPGKLEFENVYLVKELKYNLFSVSQICDNKNSVLFTDSDCIVLGKDFKLKYDTNVLLRTHRQYNMYSINLNNIVSHKNLTCLVAKASANESMLWHRRLGHLNFKTMNKLVRNNLVKGLPSKCFENNHTCVACLKGKQHKASCMTKFTWTFFLRTKDETSGILRNFITEIENPKDLKVKIIRVLVNKSQNKIPYELFNSRTPAIGFLRPFGCYVMILNTLDHLGKFDAKGDKGYFVGCSMSSKAFRVFNKRTKKVEENLHIDFLENKLIEKGADPNWLFAIDTLTNSMNYVPVVVARTSSTNISGTKDVVSQGVKKDVSFLRYIALPNWFHEAYMEFSNSVAQDPCNADVSESSGISNPTATSKILAAKQMESLTVESEFPTVSSPVPTIFLDTSPKTSSGSRIISKEVLSQEETPSLDNALTLSNRFEDTIGVEADLSNMESSILASPTPTFRIHKNHPKSQIISPVDTPVQTRHKSKEMEEHRIRPIGTKWVLKNKKDERGIVIRNKARLVLQGHTQEEDIMFAVCACARHQVTPKECHLYAVKRIFRYLKGHPKLGLWYPKESLFDLVAYSDNDYGGATQDRKSTTGGCQFLGRRLISWQCKKQTIVATSTTKAEYVAVASGCRKVLWIQNRCWIMGIIS
nr:ribonuclease H-like domain-containing protein [Tanacetum cinerariifolium]